MGERNAPNDNSDYHSNFGIDRRLSDLATCKKLGLWPIWFGGNRPCRALGAALDGTHLVSLICRS